MPSKQSSSQRKTRFRQQESIFPENVQPDMNPQTLLEVKQLLEDGDNGTDNEARPTSKPPRDFEIVQFTKKFQQERFMSHVKCSGANCRTIPSGNNFSFCGNFHLFCGQCAQNLPFCWVNDGRTLCQSKFYHSDIPLYSSFLEDYKFACLNNQYGCSFTGRAESVAKHFQMCRSFSGSDFVCPFTGCKTDQGTFQGLVAHLKSRHHSIFVERSVTAVSLRIPWGKPKGAEDYTWIPAIYKTNDVYFLIALKIQYGTLYQWIYVQDERARDDREEVYILSGFEIAEKGVTMLKVDPPQNLSTSPYKIVNGMNCFAISLEDFFDEHLMENERKQIQYFTFDLDIALL